jgi:hypothetical protein
MRYEIRTRRMEIRNSGNVRMSVIANSSGEE